MPLPAAASQRLARFAAFNPAGGVNYHLRARRHMKQLWEPFRWFLGEWLLGWQPPERGLLLVGPSAGYNLQPFLFERFEHVIVLEPDPLARWLFKRRLARAPLDRRPRLEFIAADHLVHHPERLGRLLEQSGQPALLFANVIGQLATLLDDDGSGASLEPARAAVRAALPGRSWASFHDRVSGPVAPNIPGRASAAARWSDEEVLREAYGADSAGPLVELTDHHSGGFFPVDMPHAYLRWELEPGLFHLIEAAAVARLQGAAPSPAAADPA